MKARKLRRALGVAVATAFLALLAVKGMAQVAASTNAVPELAPNVAVIAKLAKLKISDDTIIAYINKTHNSYDLDAAQVIYLHDQGMSDAVITAMLKQPEPVIATATFATPATPAPEPVASATYQQPAVTYVESEPTTYYAYQPYYYPVFSGSYWSYPVVVSYGWGGYRNYGWWGYRRSGVWYGGYLHGGPSYAGYWSGGYWHGGVSYRGGSYGGVVVRSGGFAHGGGGVVHGGGGRPGGRR